MTPLTESTEKTPLSPLRSVGYRREATSLATQRDALLPKLCRGSCGGELDFVILHFQIKNSIITRS